MPVHESFVEMLRRYVSVKSGGSDPVSNTDPASLTESALARLADELRAMEAKGNHLGTRDPQAATQLVQDAHARMRAYEHYAGGPVDPRGGFAMAPLKQEGAAVAYDAIGGGGATNSRYTVAGGGSGGSFVSSGPPPQRRIAQLAHEALRDVRELVAEMPETQGSHEVLEKLAELYQLSVRQTSPGISMGGGGGGYGGNFTQPDQARQANVKPVPGGFVEIRLMGSGGGGSGDAKASMAIADQIRKYNKCP